jgi:hypothetical protein
MIPLLRMILHLSILITPVALLHAQEDSSAAARGMWKTTLPPESFLLETVIQRMDGNQAAGYLLDLDRDSIFLQSRGMRRAVAFDDIVRITLPGRERGSSIGLHGFLIGAWAIPLAMMTRNAPGSYADVYRNDPSPLLITALLSGAATGFVAYLIGKSVERDAEPFTLTVDEAARQKELRRLERFVRPDRAPPLLHFTVQVAEVHPSETKRTDRILRDAGYVVRTEFGPWEGYADSPLTLFRKAQVSCTVKPGLALGAAYMNLTEPESHESNGAYSGELIHQLFLDHRADAWYAIATYEPLRTTFRRPLTWLCGAGIGAASLHGKLTTRITSTISSSYVSETHERPLDTGLFSVMLFTEFRVYLYSSLSLGLTGEYIHLPSVTTSPVDGFSTRGAEFDFSSWSWGMALGVHF